MTRTEIIAKAKELGLNASGNRKTKDMVADIETVTGEKIVITKEGGKDTKPATVAPKRVKAIVYSGDKDNDEVDFFVSLNGKNMKAPIGVECEIDAEFLPVLNDAKFEEHIYEVGEDGNPTGKKAIRISKRYIVEKL